MSLSVRGPKYHRRVLAVIIPIFVIAIALIFIGVRGLLNHHEAVDIGSVNIPAKPIIVSTDTPSETKPKAACDKYGVKAGLPESISIPAINTGGCLQQVGIDQHGAMAVPNNIYMAGWYVNSALPGEPGLSIIDGHISGRYNEDAIFQHLVNLHAGDKFTVKISGGNVLNYEVFNVQSVKLSKTMDILLTQDSSVTSQLNLITCGGTYDPKIKLYDRRIIVSAKLL